MVVVVVTVVVATVVDVDSLKSRVRADLREVDTKYVAMPDFL